MIVAGKGQLPFLLPKKISNLCIMGIFDAENPTDRIYLLLRDKEKFKNFRQKIEEMWSKFESLADAGFVEEFSKNFHERFWEMYLGCAFLDVGFKLDSNNEGPDLKVVSDKPAVWIEAIAVSVGTTLDKVYDADDGNAIGVPENKIILRLTHAFDEKNKKYHHYLKTGKVKPHEPCVIAINASQVPNSNSNSGSDPSYILRALVPIGPEYGVVDKGSMEVVESGFRYQPYATKENGIEIPTTAFTIPDFSIISAVLFSCVKIGNFPEIEGSDFLIVHNPFATNPLPLGWFPRGGEHWVENTKVKSRR